VNAKLARRRDRQPLGAAVAEADVGDIRARCKSELVLQLASVAPEGDVDPRPYLAVDDVAVAAKPRPPLGAMLADQVVACARLHTDALDQRRPIATHEGELEGDTFVPAREREDRLRAGEVEARAGGARLEPDARICLAGVGDERERQLAVRSGVRGRPLARVDAGGNGARREKLRKERQQHRCRDPKCSSHRQHSFQLGAATASTTRSHNSPARPTASRTAATETAS